jgi:hypothetical protein
MASQNVCNDVRHVRTNLSYLGLPICNPLLERRLTCSAFCRLMRAVIGSGYWTFLPEGTTMPRLASPRLASPRR